MPVIDAIMINLKNANLVPPLRLVFIMWLMYTLQFTFAWDLGFLGVYPRTYTGMVGILTAPMVHGNVSHLISNTFPVLFLGTVLYLFYPTIASQVFIQCYLFTNFLVWLFARPFYHIGASGLVYALAFFLISLVLFKRDMKTLFIAILIAIIYGGLVYNVASINARISWESHLLGAIAGVGNAYAVWRFFKKV